MIGIDVHMCLRDDDREDWSGAAIASLEDQGVSLHLVDGPAPLCEKMARGFAMGRNEWCSWVDSDDLVVPGAFAAVRDAIERQPGAALYFTGEHWFGDLPPFPGRQLAPFPLDHPIELAQILNNPLAAHHLCVMRRHVVLRAIELLAPLPSQASAWAVVALVAAMGGFLRIPVDGYAWRLHPRQTCWRWTDADLLQTQARIAHALDRVHRLGLAVSPAKSPGAGA